jgi:sulfide:quinone oxidoreductase
MSRIVILGGGIAGVEAAIFCRKAGFEVELISDRDYLFIYPISIWIPVSSLPFEEAKLSLEALATRHGFALTLDRVCALNAANRSFTLEKGGTRQEANVVIALGSGKMKHPGLEHTLSISGEPEQSLRLKEAIEALIVKGQGAVAFGFGGNPNDSSAVRGGPGFELFFNLHHRLKQLGLRDRYEMTFFAPMTQPGARMGDMALRMMAAQFRKNIFKTRFGTKIRRFEKDAVVFEDDSVLPSDLTMFIPAGNGSEVLRSSDLPKNAAGFVRIEPTCQVVGVPSWYAIGDAAALEGPDWKAKQGHLAEAMARVAVHNLAVDLLKRSAPRKTYPEHLNITCLMDMGSGGGLVYRDDSRSFMLPLPVLGHSLKRLWGRYYRQSKLGRIPRIPGL